MLDVIIQHRVNATFTSPAIAIEMLKLLEGTSGMESMRIFACGGSFVSDELIESMKRFLPNGEMVACYGMTETSCLLSTRENADKKGTVGRLGAGIQAAVTIRFQFEMQK